MALPKLTRLSKHSSSSIHYVVTGTYNVRDGKFNEPHPTRGDKSVKVRNFKIQGIRCPDNPYKCAQLFGRYNHLANMRYMKHLGQGRDECADIVLSFGDELDWRKPDELARGVNIVHQFADVMYPHNGVYTGYQMDTSGRVPSAHVHLQVGMFNEITGKALDHYQYYGPRMAHVLDRIIINDNAHHIKQLTVIGRYGNRGWKSHQHVQPSLAQRRLLPRVNLLMQSRLPINDEQLVNIMKPMNVIVHIHRKGEKRSSLRHPGRKPYKHDSLLMRIPGRKGTNGYIPAGQLRWLIKWSPNISLLYTAKTRRVMYALNKRYLSRTPVIAKSIIPKLAPLLKGKLSPENTIRLLNAVKNFNHKKGSDVMSELDIQGMKLYMQEMGKANKQSNGEQKMPHDDSLYASLYASEANEASSFGVTDQPVRFSSAANDDFKSATGSSYSGSLDADSFYRSTTAEPSSASSIEKAQSANAEPQPSMSRSESGKAESSASSMVKKDTPASSAQTLTAEQAEYLADSASQDAYRKIAKLAGISPKQFGKVQMHYFYQNSSVADAVNYVSGADQPKAISIMNSAHSAEARANSTSYIPYGNPGYMDSMLSASPIYQNSLKHKQQQEQYKENHKRDRLAQTANHIIGNEAFVDKSYANNASRPDLFAGATRQHGETEQRLMDMYSAMSPQGQKYIRSMALLGTINLPLFDRITSDKDLTAAEEGMKNGFLRQAGYVPDENGKLVHVGLGMPLGQMTRINKYLSSHQKSLKQGDFFRAIHDERDKELWQKKYSPAYRKAYAREMAKLTGQKELTGNIQKMFRNVGGTRQQNTATKAIRQCADTNNVATLVRHNSFKPEGAIALHEFITWAKPFAQKVHTKLGYIADYAQGLLHKARIRMDLIKKVHHLHKMKLQHESAENIRPTLGHRIIDQMASYGVCLSIGLKAKHGSINFANANISQLSKDDQNYIHRRNVIRANGGMIQDDYDLKMKSLITAVRDYNTGKGRKMTDKHGDPLTKKQLVGKIKDLKYLHPTYQKALEHYIDITGNEMMKRQFTLYSDETLSDRQEDAVINHLYQQAKSPAKQEKSMKKINAIEKRNPVYAQKRQKQIKVINSRINQKESKEQQQKQAQIQKRNRSQNREQGIER